MILLMAISNDIILQPILTTHNLWGNNGFLGNSKVIALFDMVSYQSPCTFFYSEKITFLAQNHHSLSWVWVKNGGGLTWKIGKKETILEMRRNTSGKIVMLISIYFHFALQGKLSFSSFSSESVSYSYLYFSKCSPLAKQNPFDKISGGN